MSRGFVFLHRCRKYVQENMQSCRTVVTGHINVLSLCCIIFKYNNSRAKRSGKFWNTHTKIPLIMPKILFSDMHILNITGRIWHPPLDPRLHDIKYSWIFYICMENDWALCEAPDFADSHLHGNNDIMVHKTCTEKWERSDSFLCPKAPIPSESKKSRDNTKAPPQTSITLQLRIDLGRSVGVAIAIQLV